MSSKKPKKKKRLLGKIIDGVSLIIIVFFLGLIVYSGTLHPLRIVLTGSMEPTINPGDVVLIKKVDNPATITPGEIVMYTRPGYKDPIVHRVIEVTRWNGQACFIIKGDHNPAPDPPYPGKDGVVYPCVPGYAIEGKVVAIIPSIGKPVIWLFEH